MSFTAIEFILVFLPAVIGGYYLLPKSWRIVWLLAASIYYYTQADPVHFPILLCSILFNFWISRAMSLWPEKRKKAAVFGITVNVLTLCVLKYSNFLFRTAGAWRHSPIQWAFQFSFPLGISFFTVQQIIFLMDRYEGLLEERPFLDYALFASFFPYVSMGPIAHWKQVTARVSEFGRLQLVATGLLLFALGLAKKVLLADQFGKWADAGFSSGSLDFGNSWVTSLTYTMQLYFDFSGYTDMALGAAAMLGISLPVNFDRPYLAVSIIDFWKRWHITLSKFITTYLFTPLARIGGKITFGKAMFATMGAMTIVGLWHGPSWNFVVFGFLHGLALVVNNLWRKTRIRFPKVLGWALTMVFVNLAFVFFRTENLSRASYIIRSMAGLTRRAGAPVSVFESLSGWAVAASFGIGVLLIRFEPNLEIITRSLGNLRSRPSENWSRWVEIGIGAVAACLLGVCLKYSQKTQFLYFRF